MVEWRGRRGTCLGVGSGHRNETSDTKKIPNTQELTVGNNGHSPHLIILNKKPLDVPEFHFNPLAPASSPSPRVPAHFPDLNLFHPTAMQPALCF